MKDDSFNGLITLLTAFCRRVRKVGLSHCGLLSGVSLERLAHACTNLQCLDLGGISVVNHLIGVQPGEHACTNLQCLDMGGISVVNKSTTK